ncbi:Amuc_1099 family pilus-like system protein [Verrucomicrobiota bacterium]
MTFLKRIWSLLKSVYDKLIAFVFLLVLLLSLLNLAVRLGSIRMTYGKFEDDINKMEPKNPNAESVDPLEYNQWFEKMSNPFVIQGNSWSNRLLVPNTRIRCQDLKCSRPIPREAKECPFCLVAQNFDPPKDKVGKDSDRDGIPDKDEKQFGLDPDDPLDANKDKDGDGFDNITEYRLKTDLTDPDDYPPLIDLLRVDRIVAEEFQLLFRSDMKLEGFNPDDSQEESVKYMKFGLNLRSGEKTIFAKLNETVEIKMGEEKVGFKLVKYEKKIEKKPLYRNSSTMKKTDVSELTLQRGDKEIVLIKGKAEKHKEYRAYLMFDLDKSQRIVKKDDMFELKKDKKYQVINIDSKLRIVIIRNLQTGEEKIVGKGVSTKKAIAPDAHFEAPKW